MTPEQFKRLPKYAQEYINSLARKVSNGANMVNKLTDDQTPTRIWTDSFEDCGEGQKTVKRYFNATHVTIEQNGVQLRIDNLWDPNADIRLSWGPAGSLSCLGDICFIPTSYQQAKLVNLAYNDIEYNRLLKQKGTLDERQEA